jgi:hypothetical protein
MQVGNKVVCIDDTFHPVVHASYFQLPRIDETYTIRAVYIGRGVETPHEIGLLLEELSNPLQTLKGGATAELGFNAERFRLLDEMQVSRELEHHGEKQDKI